MYIYIYEYIYIYMNIHKTSWLILLGTNVMVFFYFVAIIPQLEGQSYNTIDKDERIIYNNIIIGIGLLFIVITIIIIIYNNNILLLYIIIIIVITINNRPIPIIILLYIILSSLSIVL
eukprot:GHVL01040474.1.p3 GENE.GHVL01040474.1~~GHVL01040474.1.p3  ORF type:complete len:118 (+),score=33.26 GHVL01040474.1:879-1232(+)